MSWLFSRRLIDENLSRLRGRIQSEAKRANSLLGSMSPEEQRRWKEWTENWSAVQAIQSSTDEGRLLEDVLLEASIRQWAQGDSCPCDGYGNVDWKTDKSDGVCPSQERHKNRQPTGKFGADASFGAFSPSREGVNFETESNWRPICVSLRCLRALVAEYLQAQSAVEGSYAQLNVMPTPHKFWRNDKMMDHSRLSRFGLTCALLTEADGEALLTAFLEASHARTLASPATVQDSKETDPPCGSRWRGSLAKYDHQELKWKTAQCSLLGDSEEFLETWPRWGTTVDGELYLLPQPALPIYGRESGFFPTPVASMCKGSSIKSLTRKDGRDRTRDRLDHFIYAHHGGKLNPEWVEWLMGWPIGWTDLKPLATDKFPSA